MQNRKPQSHKQRRRSVRTTAVSVLVTASAVAGAAVTTPVLAIVNGSSASAPYVVQVVTKRGGGSYFCGGSVIGNRSVLTAAHCAEGSSSISVRIGSSQRGQGTSITVSKFKVQAGYDLAVLTLAAAAPTGPVALGGKNPSKKTQGDVYGWGDVGGGKLSQVLKTARVRVTAVGGGCKDGANGPAICTTGITGHHGNGDSGGPLMVNGQQVGVVSTAGGVFASVPSRLAWIKSQIV